MRASASTNPVIPIRRGMSFPIKGTASRSKIPKTRLSRACFKVSILLSSGVFSVVVGFTRLSHQDRTFMRTLLTSLRMHSNTIETTSPTCDQISATLPSTGLPSLSNTTTFGNSAFPAFFFNAIEISPSALNQLLYALQDLPCRGLANCKVIILYHFMSPIASCIYNNSCYKKTDHLSSLFRYYILYLSCLL